MERNLTHRPLLEIKQIAQFRHCQESKAPCKSQNTGGIGESLTEQGKNAKNRIGGDCPKTHQNLEK